MVNYRMENSEESTLAAFKIPEHQSVIFHTAFLVYSVDRYEDDKQIHARTTTQHEFKIVEKKIMNFFKLLF